MLIEAAVAGFLLALLLGGSPKNLLRVHLRMPALLIVPLFLSAAARAPEVGQLLARSGAAGAYALCVLRYGCLIAFAAVNRRVPGVLLVGAGGALNALVTLANGGTMPVSRAAVALSTVGERRLLLNGEILNYRMAGAGTHLAFLCDRILVRGFFYYSLSVGDLLAAAGIFVFVSLQMGPRRPARVFRPAEEAQKKQ